MRIFIVSAFLVMQLSSTFADSRRSQIFSYDSAGNLIQTTSLITSNPPVISSATPGYINIGRTINVLVTGTDLFGAQVSTSYPDLTISNVNSTVSQLTFTLTASDLAAIGIATINFVTSLGSGSSTIIVEERAPGIFTEPNPIALLADAQPKTIQLTIDQTQPISKTYDINISNSIFASLSQSTITFPAGSNSATVDITGLAEGNTELTLSSTSPLFNLSMPVYVTAPYSGETYNSSDPVGIIVGTENPSGVAETTPIASSVVGLIVGTENPSGAAEDTRLPSPLVGLIIGTENPTGAAEDTRLPSPLVGLIVGTENPTGAAETSPITSSLTGLIVGPVVKSMNPNTASPTDSITLTFTGINLQNVNQIIVNPANDLTLGNITINPAGTQLSVPLSVGINAVPGVHQVIVNTSTVQVPLFNIPPMELTIQ